MTPRATRRGYTTPLLAVTLAVLALLALVLVGGARVRQGADAQAGREVLAKVLAHEVLAAAATSGPAGADLLRQGATLHAGRLTPCAASGDGCVRTSGTGAGAGSLLLRVTPPCAPSPGCAGPVVLVGAPAGRVPDLEQLTAG